MSTGLATLNRDDRVYIAGRGGLVGSAIWRALERAGFSDLVGLRSAELDLEDREQTQAHFAATRPKVVVLAAAHVGGILANSTRPVDFLTRNLRIQLNVFEAARAVEVDRLLFLGSSCVYPKDAPQPIKEEYLLTGPLEPSNDAYAIAKIAGILQVQAARCQYGVHWISAMPTNLYGPGDNYDPVSSHVLPALIKRFHDATRDGDDTATIWGSGTPRREFMHVDDLAEAVLFLLENYDEADCINVGTGSDVTILELAELTAVVAGFGGSIELDGTKPDGMSQKLLDVSRLTALGWQSRIGLGEGLRDAYRWYGDHVAQARTGRPLVGNP
jgi:GDP-L-fucose synthase